MNVRRIVLTQQEISDILHLALLIKGDMEKNLGPVNFEYYANDDDGISVVITQDANSIFSNPVEFSGGSTH